MGYIMSSPVAKEKAALHAQHWRREYQKQGILCQGCGGIGGIMRSVSQLIERKNYLE